MTLLHSNTAIANATQTILGLSSALLVFCSLIAILAAYFLYTNKSSAISLLISLNLVGLFMFLFPYYDALERFAVTPIKITAYKSALFFLVTLFLYRFLQQHIWSDYSSSFFQKWFERLTIAITGIGLSATLVMQMTGASAIIPLSLALQKFLVTPLSLFWWVSASLISMALVS